MEKISGIYSITHISNGKMYVGSAIDIEKRWSEHRSELNHIKHDNPRLQNSWNKYGEQQFNFRLLEEVKDPSKLLEREQYWIDSLHSSNRNKGFNIRKVAESNFGLKHTEETKEKISQGNKGKNSWMVGENNPFFGQKHTEDSLVKMRTPRSEEVKQKFSVAAQKRWEGHTKEKICLNCQVSFNTRLSDDNDFCSKQCNNRYHGKLRTKTNTIEKICLLFPNTFRTSISEDKKYCSRKCWAVSMRGNKN
jgi:group I intron endonuclease